MGDVVAALRSRPLSVPSPSPPSPQPSTLALAAAFVVMCVVWGSTWLVIKEGARQLPPATAAAARFVVAWLLMVAVTPWLVDRDTAVRPSRDLVWTTGVLQFFVSYTIVYWAETILPSGLTAVLWAVYPLLLGVLSLVMLPGERLSGRQWLGLVLGFAGIAGLFTSDLRAAGREHLRAGAILLLSPFAVAIANAWLRRRNSAASAVLLNRDGLCVGAGLLMLFALATEWGAPATWSAAAIGSVVYLAAIGTCLAFTVYFWTLRWLPASTVALTSYVTPLIALGLGVWVGDEPFTLATALSTLVVLLGVALARRPRAPAR